MPRRAEACSLKPLARRHCGTIRNLTHTPAHEDGALFDDYAGAYEDACQNGLRLSGESIEFFALGRVDYTARWLHEVGEHHVTGVVDFGCGVGAGVTFLRQAFPFARIVGLDPSTTSIERARSRYGDVASFSLVEDYGEEATQRLVYCSGVFHHIPPSSRLGAARRIFRILTPGGHFALWENNPWNPGTRMVMRRIPFDREAIPVPPPEARRLLAEAGFQVVGARYRFYFPRQLSMLRGLERFGERIPLGAQYCVLARRPAA